MRTRTEAESVGARVPPAPTDGAGQGRCESAGGRGLNVKTSGRRRQCRISNATELRERSAELTARLGGPYPRIWPMRPKRARRRAIRTLITPGRSVAESQPRATTKREDGTGLNVKTSEWRRRSPSQTRLTCGNDWSDSPLLRCPGLQPMVDHRIGAHRGGSRRCQRAGCSTRPARSSSPRPPSSRPASGSGTNAKPGHRVRSLTCVDRRYNITTWLTPRTRTS